ncbi:zinc metallopeptidase [Christensenellaceae bacterium OttesenSCG-928-K19]|nr:zinc metallopeptidase [Christensenellaceae bacterium OttesenSCG-928-K19]
MYYPASTAFVFDWTWLLLIPALVISIWAQAKVSSTYKKYAKVPAASRASGADFARTMLRQNGVTNVAVHSTTGTLTDHFDPRNNTVNLSEDVYAGHSVASIAIAAHECGHVLQKEKKYGPMRVRNAIVPVTNICSRLAFPLILIGIIFSSMSILATIGVWVYFAVVIFQLVTLPVEFNASGRALANIKASGVLTETEQAEAKKVLSAAAMTYVAGMLSSFLSFLRLLLIANRRR